MRKNPCYGCVAPKRHIGCHGTCQEHKDWKAEWDKYQQHVRQQRQIDQQLIGDALKYRTKYKKW
jgi:hypothetical protein